MYHSINIKNHRLISYNILSVIYKSFTKDLTTRLKSAINSVQPRDKAGIRSGVSTTDDI